MLVREHERNIGATPFALAPVPGTALARPLSEELVGLGGVDVLELLEVVPVAAMSPAPPRPPAVRGTSVGAPVSPLAF
jgi:hypothetical protein